jgi:hypothetical protein
MRTRVATIGILIAVIALIYMTQRIEDGAAKTYTATAPTPSATVVDRGAAPLGRQSRLSGFVSTDAS